MLVSYPIAMVLLATLATIVGGQISEAAIFWGALCGVSQAFGVWWFYAALGAGPISVVSPLTAVLVAGIPVAVGLALGERPGVVAGVGVVVALVAVVMVSREATDEDVTPHKFTATVAWLTVGSGIAFGLNFVLIDQAPVEAKLWPLVFARLTATVLVIVIAALSQQSAPAHRDTAATGDAGGGPGCRSQHRDAAGTAGVTAVAGRRADVAVPGGDGAARDRGAARAGDPLAGGGHGAGAGGDRDDRRRLEHPVNPSVAGLIVPRVSGCPN